MLGGCGREGVRANECAAHVMHRVCSQCLRGPRPHNSRAPAGEKRDDVAVAVAVAVSAVVAL